MAVRAASLTVGDIAQADRARFRILTALAVIIAIIGGLLAGVVTDGRSVTSIALVLAIALPVVWWQVPQWGVFFLAAAATVVEQFRYSIGNTGLDAFTDKFPVFASLQGGAGFNGLPMSPIDITIFLLLLIWITRGVNDRSLRLPRSHVAAAVGVLLLLVAVALIRGLGLGGNDTRAALWEMRPWLYLGTAYLFASQFLTTRRSLRGVLWVFVIGTGFKALQGVYIFTQTLSMNPRPEAILAHEESFFFGIFAMLVLGLWLFRQRGRLRTVATALLPLVLVADMANSRRDAFVVLAVGSLVMAVIAYVALPERRFMLRRVAVGVVLVSSVYMAVEWNGSGFTAEPARAVRSVIAPDARDALSNQYRRDEDANLGYMIQDSTPLGTGFGVPINYGRVAIVNINNVDQFIDWVPHNGALYVWMRMGIAGEAVLWLFVIAVILTGVRAARSHTPEVALFGAMTACAAAAWVIMGYTDMGFFWFRIALGFGILIGALHAALSLERAEQQRG